MGESHDVIYLRKRPCNTNLNDTNFAALLSCELVYRIYYLVSALNIYKKCKLLQQHYKDRCMHICTDTHAFIYSGSVLLSDNHFGWKK